MLLDQETENEIVFELCQLLGRAILPVTGSDGPGAPAGVLGTAFFYSELVIRGKYLCARQDSNLRPWD